MGNPATGHEIRDHRVTFGDTGVAATDISATATYVEGAEMFAPLVIGVVIHGNMHESDLTSAEEARTLAAHLLVAAERLDELNGSDR